MNYASFIYKMIYLNNRLKHAKKKKNVDTCSDREKIMIIRSKFVKYLFKGSNSK